MDSYQAAFKNTPIPSIIYTLGDVEEKESLRVTDANPAACKAVAYDFIPHLGKLALEVFPNLKGKILDAFYESIVSQKMVDLGDLEYGDENVPKSTFKVKSTPITETACLVTYTNITELRALEQALKGYVKTNPEAGVYLMDKGVLNVMDGENAHEKGLQIIGWSILAGIIILLALSALGIFLMTLR